MTPRELINAVKEENVPVCIMAKVNGVEEQWAYFNGKQQVWLPDCYEKHLDTELPVELFPLPVELSGIEQRYAVFTIGGNNG